QNANPLGAVLEQMIGATPAALTAWQQAIVAGVFELCLVGVMVGYELLGHAKQLVQERAVDRVTRGIDHDSAPVIQLPTPMTRRPRHKASSVNPKTTVGSVKAFVLDSVFPGDGECTEMKTLMQGYRAWCAKRGLLPLALSDFLDEIEKICG